MLTATAWRRAQRLSSQTDTPTLVSGVVRCAMDLVCWRAGPMAPVTMATSWMARRTGAACSPAPMVAPTTASGTGIRCTATESTSMSMGASMKANGARTPSLAGASRSTPTVPVTKESFGWAASTAQAFTVLAPASSTRGSTLTTRWTARGGTSLPTAVRTAASGKADTCTAMARWSGPTARGMRVATSETRSRGRALSLGQTAASTAASGLPASPMESASSLTRTARRSIRSTTGACLCTRRERTHPTLCCNTTTGQRRRSAKRPRRRKFSPMMRRPRQQPSLRCGQRRRNPAFRKEGARPRG
mmetsp:Transcript_95567/g.275977  ORF Transcript_95567/g.275977 Transcript_95567/m.275977 type:complete len:304 (+) Transcript_95567:590-1501(+)